MIRKCQIGRAVFSVKVEPHERGRLRFSFGWSGKPEWTALKNEIKSMQGARWDPTAKFWHAEDCDRNDWVMQFLDKDMPDPYEAYDPPLIEVAPSRDLYKHQEVMLNHAFTYKQCLLAAEMGTGKTLVIIELLEKVKPQLAWYVAPKFALQAIELEFEKWGAKVYPVFMSYDRMKSIVKGWTDGFTAPPFIVFDESAQLKTPNSQRSQCAQAIANGARQDNNDPYIIGMSGAPAPKSPVDWWRQCEIIRPGFIKEGHPMQFQRRLALIEHVMSPVSGGTYPKLITWWDDANKCKHCGQLKEDPCHDPYKLSPEKCVRFEPSVNEVSALYRRMQGLVLVQRKKDCLDLPDMIFRTVKCETTGKIKRMSKLILKSAHTTIEGLTRLRELSDGFQYTNRETEDLTICERCAGTGKLHDYVAVELPEQSKLVTPNTTCELQDRAETECPDCKGTGQVHVVERVAESIACPKDDALRGLLKENEDNGRVVVFAGFTASVDRVVKIGIDAGWVVIRVDGKSDAMGGSNGIWTSSPMIEPLKAFQDKERKIPKIAFVANQATASTALTLTEAYMAIYYSNTFNGDHRIQSQARIHRIGMDVNKGAIIVDIVHLASDQYVIDNLLKKVKLLGLTLGELQAELGEIL